MDSTDLSSAEIEAFSREALERCGARSDSAAALARSIAAAEVDGIASHGVAYLPTYCEHLLCGKVDGAAEPTVEIRGGVIRVDAKSGFAHLAIARGSEVLVPIVRENGVAVLSVTNSYNCGVLAYHTEALARSGFVALGFTNSPASIAPWGGKTPVLGTNPWSLAVPDNAGDAAFVIDQSASVVAKSEVMKRQREGASIPDTWAFDRDGLPTTDPNAALAGAMAPAGGYKGVGSALLVEIFAACLTGATPGVIAAPFSGTAGGPPRTGQFFIAIDPGETSGGAFFDRLDTVVTAFLGAGASRLPGDRRKKARAAHQGAKIAIPTSLIDKVKQIAKL